MRELFDEGIAHFRKKEFRKAHGILRACVSDLKTDPRLRVQAYDAAAFMLLQDRRPAHELEEFLATCEAPDGASSHRIAYDAALALYHDDLDRFWRLMGRLPAYDCDRFGPWNRGLRTAPTREVHDECMAKALERARVTDSDGSASRPTHMLFSGDSGYFNRFAEFCVSSYRQVGGASPMSFHVVNPDHQAVQLAERLQHHDASVSVRFVSPGPTSKAFLAAYRYLVAADYMREKNASVFVFDMDIAFKKDVNDMFGGAGLDREKVVVRRSPFVVLPWQKITAAALYLPYNEVGVRFAEHLRVFLEGAFSEWESEDIWWVDQNATLTSFLAVDRSSWQRIPAAEYLALPTLFSDKEKAISGAATSEQ